jgi:hypothetical protein
VPLPPAVSGAPTTQAQHAQAQQALAELDPAQATQLRTDKAFKKRVLAILKV